jgi:hypothetical protein
MPKEPKVGLGSSGMTWVWVAVIALVAIYVLLA